MADSLSIAFENLKAVLDELSSFATTVPPDITQIGLLIQADKSRSHDAAQLRDHALVISEGYRSRVDSIHHQLGLACSTLRSLRNSSVELIPINRLPNELLSRIFLFGINSENNRPDYYEAQEVRAAREKFPKLSKVLPAVCQAWRSVALHLEKLWRPVYIPSQHLSESSKALLTRFGSPLNLHIDLSSHESWLERILSRCKSLHLTSADDGSLSRTLRKMEGEFPALRSLSLINQDVERWDLNPLVFIEGLEGGQEMLRNVRHARIEYMPLNRDSPLFVHLITLDLKWNHHQLKPSDIEGILHSSPCLEILTLSGCLDWQERNVDPTASPLRPIQLNSLQSLSIRAEPASIVWIFAQLKAPLLGQLCVTNFSFIPEAPSTDPEDTPLIVLRQLFHFISQHCEGSQCRHITRLALDMSWSNNDLVQDATRILELLPRLKMLHLNVVPFSYTILATQFPDLTDLSLVDVLHETSSDMLLGIVQSRSLVFQPLERLTITLPLEWSFSVCSSLLSLLRGIVRELIWIPPI